MNDGETPEEMQREVESLIDVFFSRDTLITCGVIMALCIIVAVIALWLISFRVGQ